MSNQVPHPFAFEPVGSGLFAAPFGWHFGADVAAVFDDHARRSIPGYADAHQRCLTVADEHLRRRGRAYDLGSATGTLSRALATAHPDATVVGVDAEPSMIAEARRRSDGCANLEFQCASLEHVALRPACLIACLYTLHFIAVEERARVLARMGRALEPGGALLLFEKVTLPDGQATRRRYDAFKLENGFTEREIRSKTRALEGILVAMSIQENVAMLRAAGFRDVKLIDRAICFQGFLAVK